MTLDIPADGAQPVVTDDLIPDGSFVMVTMKLRPGGVDGSAEIDRGLLKAWNAPGSDVLSLDWRKFRQLFPVVGGKVDEKGASIGWNISRRIFRAMIDSAFGLDPGDMSETAKAKRQLRGLSDLDGISFVAKVAIAQINNPRCPNHNRLDHPVLPTEKEWHAVINGEIVPPRPLRPRSAGHGHSAMSAQMPVRAGMAASATRELHAGRAAEHAGRGTACAPEEAGRTCLVERLMSAAAASARARQ